MPTEDGGFLITQMGTADGTEPGRVAEFDGQLHYVANHFGTVSLFHEWATEPATERVQPSRHLRAPGSEPNDDRGLSSAQFCPFKRLRRPPHPRMVLLELRWQW
jgi:hypothetical protein